MLFIVADYNSNYFPAYNLLEGNKVLAQSNMFSKFMYI